MPFRLFTLLVLVGCTPSYIRRAPSLGPEQRTKTLLLHASVNEESDDDSRAVGHVTTDTLVQDREIVAFGRTVIDVLLPVLEQHGVDLVVEPERAGLAQHIDWSSTWSIRMAPLWNSLTTVSTAWVDERGAYIGGLHADHLFRRSGFARIAKRLNPDGNPEGYLFITVRVITTSRWLVIRAPEVRLNVFVTDERGQEILRAQGFGSGRSRFLGADRSRENLARALQEAIEAMTRRPVRRFGQSGKIHSEGHP